MSTKKVSLHLRTAHRMKYKEITTEAFDKQGIRRRHPLGFFDDIPSAFYPPLSASSPQPNTTPPIRYCLIQIGEASTVTGRPQSPSGTSDLTRIPAWHQVRVTGSHNGVDLSAENSPGMMVTGATVDGSSECTVGWMLNHHPCSARSI